MVRFSRLEAQGTVWDSDSGTWTPAPVYNGKLAPLGEVEDQADQQSPLDGALGDSSNQYWDGDYRIDFEDGWQNADQLNPFDIDSDGLVELPMATDPSQVAGVSADEADFATVLMVTITHELGHAVAGSIHTKNSDCLMNEKAVDWKRADYFSDYFRSLIRIHNKIR